MDQPSDTAGIHEELARFGREPQGVKHLTVYKPPRSTSQRGDAREFSVPFETFSPEMIAELTEMTPAQRMRFPALYEQAIQCMRKETGKAALMEEDLDISHGYAGMKLERLTSMLHEEIGYYTNWHERSNDTTKGAGRRSKTPKAVAVAVDETSEENPELEERYYFQKFQLEPLIQNQQDLTSYWALYNKLRDLRRTGIFDHKDAPPLKPKQLCTPGNLTVIDMSDCGEQQVANMYQAWDAVVL